MRQLGQLEAVVMAELWAAEDALTVRAVLNRVNDVDRVNDVNRADRAVAERQLAYTTVMTVLENLRRKDLVARTKAGRGYDYRPVLSREEHTAALMEQVLAGSADRHVTLLRFAEQISPEELTSLREAVEAVAERQHRR